ncbi:MAG TPA: hypothetical protein VLH39_00230 [Magnetospirillaceae bacterium]|nr:hypothetical protein [Magnetospirillaceae bacterium]
MKSKSALCSWAVVLSAVLVFASCAGRAGPVREVQRESLFTLGYGTMEDQLDIFRVGGMAPPGRTRIAMRDGIFFLSNGNSAKVLTLSSFGDLLSMIYNPDRNPPPVVLSQPAASTAGRTARPYPFLAPGEIAVDSRKHIFVEDQLPLERRVFDPETNTSLEFVVLRFSTDGEFIDFLGQEGIGGTPFPLITGIHVTAQDGLVVICMTREAWLVYWFDSRGILESTIKIRRNSLPRPEGRNLLASLERIYPDPDGDAVFLKVDYYAEIIDPATQTRSGMKYDRAIVYRMDARTAEYTDQWEILPFEPPRSPGQEAAPVRIWEFLGAARGRNLFFRTTDEAGNTFIAIYDSSARALRRFSISIEPDELHYMTLYLSPDGILCALLGTRFEARVVWWRFDRVLSGGIF